MSVLPISIPEHLIPAGICADSCTFFYLSSRLLKEFIDGFSRRLSEITRAGTNRIVLKFGIFSIFSLLAFDFCVFDSIFRYDLFFSH